MTPTKEPWSNLEDTDGTIRGGPKGQTIICFMFDPSSPSNRSCPRSKANGPLIAAAPRLLAACEAARDEYERHNVVSAGYDACCGAIAKAKDGAE